MGFPTLGAGCRSACAPWAHSNPLAPTSLRLERSGKRRLPRRSFNEVGHLDLKSNLLQATARHASVMNPPNIPMKFYYTYILESVNKPNRFYVGFTEDLESRLISHNQGNNPHTSRYRPWRVKTAIAFTDRKMALSFEAYLKSPSGRAFAKKRL